MCACYSVFERHWLSIENSTLSVLNIILYTYRLPSKCHYKAVKRHEAKRPRGPHYRNYDSNRYDYSMSIMIRSRSQYNLTRVGHNIFLIEKKKKDLSHQTPCIILNIRSSSSQQPGTKWKTYEEKGMRQDEWPEVKRYRKGCWWRRGCGSRPILTTIFNCIH